MVAVTLAVRTGRAAPWAAMLFGVGVVVAGSLLALAMVDTTVQVGRSFVVASRLQQAGAVVVGATAAGILWVGVGVLLLVVRPGGGRRAR